VTNDESGDLASPACNQSASGNTSARGSGLLLSLMFPGVVTAERRPLFGFSLILAGVFVPLLLLIWVVLRRDQLPALVIGDRFLFAAMSALVLATLARSVAVWEATGSSDAGRRRVPRVVATLVTLAMLMPAAFGVVRIQQTRSVLGSFFTRGEWTDPLFVVSDNRFGQEGQFQTVLLLGGDGAPGRPDNRTDSMMLVMMHRESGRTALISVARNLAGVQFPEGSALADRYPTGFTDLANAIFTVVERSSELSLSYQLGDLYPPAVAVSQALGYSLGVTVDDYLFVDLGGFSDLIDAVGGVRLELDSRYPLPPNLSDLSRPLPASIGPGLVLMDGPIATGYARTRETDSDVGRTARQRQLMGALIEQISPADALVRLPQISQAVQGAFDTSVDRNEIGRLLRSLSGPRVVEELGLSSPLVNSSSPDWVSIRSLIDEVRLALITGVPSRFVNG